MAEKTNANIGFEKQLWDAACVLWGHIPAAEYRKVIIGLIFLRYISTAFEKRYNQLVAEGDGFEDDRSRRFAPWNKFRGSDSFRKIVFFINYLCFDCSKNLQTAISFMIQSVPGADKQN